MPIVMTRIDDRLLHGQVSLGWGPALRPDAVVVADDAAAEDPWEREVYEASGPDGAEVLVVSLDEAARRHASWRKAADRVLLLVRGPEAVVRLLDAGCSVGDVVNVGGLHGGAGRRACGFGYHLSDIDIAHVRALESRGVRCEFRPLPGDEAHDLARVMTERTDA